jgi:hypothetical protein
MPSWREIYESSQNSYNEDLKNSLSPLIYLPILNIPFIFKERKKTDTQIHVLQGSIITIGFIYSIMVGSTSI